MAPMKHFIRNSAKVMLAFVLANYSLFLDGSSIKSDSARVEVLMNSKLLTDSKIKRDARFISSIDITPKQLILLSTNNQFYLLGWGLINPISKPVDDNITSFAYTFDNLLMVIRNDELCSFGLNENLTKFIKLPRKGMGISAGKYVMYIYDRSQALSQNSLFILAQGGKYKKILEVPDPIQSVVEMNNSVLLATGNALFSFDIKRKNLKALFALAKGKEIISIAMDTASSRIYFSTDSIVYAIKDTKTIVVTDKIGGILRFFHGGLIVFDPQKQLMVRLTGIENEIASKQLASAATSSAKTNNPETSMRPYAAVEPAKTKPAYEILTNDIIVSMVKRGLSDESIIDLINRNRVDFNLSVDSMVELSGQNVSSTIILAMKQAMKKKSAKAP
jgi:hypothetical protein